MFTRCPGCSTVHPVNAAILALNGGQYRCGKCNKTSNALDSLFDDWPEPGRKPAGRGEPPVLGMEIDLEEANRARKEPEGSGLTGDAPESESRNSRAGRWLLRTAWLVGVIAVGGFIIFKAAEFAGHPVLEPDEVEKLKETLGLGEPAAQEVFRDVSMIHLVSRELASDPGRPGLLRLRATIVNRAPRSQPYPSLEVVLFDAAGSRLESYAFEPADYLSPGSRPGAAMSPHAYLPLSLELEDPGEQAVGFELSFH